MPTPCTFVAGAGARDTATTWVEWAPVLAKATKGSSAAEATLVLAHASSSMRRASKTFSTHSKRRMQITPNHQSAGEAQATLLKKSRALAVCSRSSTRSRCVLASASSCMKMNVRSRYSISSVRSLGNSGPGALGVTALLWAKRTQCHRTA